MTDRCYLDLMKTTAGIDADKFPAHTSFAMPSLILKSQGLNFEKVTVSGSMRSRSDGRCPFKKEAFASHGCHSVERQQGHRIEIGVHFSGAWNQRLAAASAIVRQT
jgi:hypothetical protein